ncbi:hypothetical protein RIF29_38672 [Crotalaria pallida]|uniref:Uncharacterized protein n=1 Tax=Crotalaria pallida TaxID=3830 RepID=A0AAN9DZQ9_CROPI
MKIEQSNRLPWRDNRLPKFGTFSWWLPYLHGNRKLFSHKVWGDFGWCPLGFKHLESETYKRGQPSPQALKGQAVPQSVTLSYMVNSSGVMAIIFSTSSLALPGTLARFTG